MELGAAETGTGTTATRVINAVSARSTSIHASRTASRSVISWLIPAFGRKELHLHQILAQGVIEMIEVLGDLAAIGKIER